MHDLIFLFPLIFFFVLYFETETHIAKDDLQLPRPDLELLFLLLFLSLYRDYRHEPPHSDYSLDFCCLCFVLTVSLISRENPVRGSRVRGGTASSGI